QGLDAYLSMLEGSRLPWLVNYRDGDLSDGFGRLVLERGGHVRVGIEDYGGPGTPRNEDLVTQIVELGRSLGRRPATAEETI
ncbi:3-keto-5-aminohexanoate cleavage protein, partial [Klebsiella pneumoniae]|nr:3-keto-5-aminohexanoate cleavage protein [Klebsiella pneumoniae]